MHVFSYKYNEAMFVLFLPLFPFLNTVIHPTRPSVASKNPIVYDGVFIKPVAY
jgi:hypothetical protein